MKPSLLIFSFFTVFAISSQARAATYSVTLTTDPVPSGGAANCENLSMLTPNTLRWAVVQANVNMGTDTVRVTVDGTVLLNSTCGGIIFREAALWTGRPAFIVSPSSANQGDLVTIQLSLPNTVSMGLIYLDGRGAGYPGNRGIRVKAGRLSMGQSRIVNFTAPTTENGDGAGILARPVLSFVPNVALDRVHIGHNKATANAGSDGGGIFFDGTGSMTITDCLIERNEASGHGGGISYEPDGTTTDNGVFSSTVLRNSAIVEGGGIYLNASGGTSKIVNSTVSGNSATDMAAMGGGLSIIDGIVEILFSTIAFNLATDGSQIWNESTSLEVNATILSGAVDVCAGVVGGNDNLASDISCVPLSAIIADPLLEPIADNGGSCTSGYFHACLTHRPNPDASPVIDQVAWPPTTGVDQRHFVRPGPSYWIGAYED